MCGLCGNFDGIQNNDLTSSSLQVEEDPVDFGNSWKVNAQCADTKKVHLGSACMEGTLTLVGAVVAGTVGRGRAGELGLSCPSGLSSVSKATRW